MVNKRFEDQNKDQLQRELRRRGLDDSGTKAELVERLHRSDRGAGQERPSQQGRDAAAGRGRRPSGPEVVRAAREQFEELAGRTPESISGLVRTEDGWQVLVDVVELQRVPRTTDVLGTYDVRLDDDAQITGYERRERYVRSTVSDE